MDLEKLVGGVVKKKLREFPGMDREDLMSQGYLLCCLKAPKWRLRKGASLETFLYSQVSYGLQDYINRKLLPEINGIDGMRRVSMELIDQEVSLETDNETRIALEEIRLTLPEGEQGVFDMMRDGYTYREIAEQEGISLGALTKMVYKWREQYA